jgi:hypothetical protein
MMIKIQSTIKCFLIASLFALVSCSDDDTTITPDPEPVILAPEVEIYEADKIHNNLTLAVVNGSNNAFLVDKTGERLHKFNFPSNLGTILRFYPMENY